MSYLGTKPANAVVTSEQIADGVISTNDLANNAVTLAKMSSDAQQKGMRNRIINGAMVIDQRNAGASVANTSTSFSVDRWKAYGTQNSKYTAQQLSASPPAGFINYVTVTSSAATSLGATDIFKFSQSIEGFNIQDLNWGTINAKAATLSFWVQSSLTGTFGGSILAYTNGNPAYPFSYSIPVANTWTQISVTIPGPTSGTFSSGNTGYIEVIFGLGVGSTYSGNANGTWQAANYQSATGATSVVGVNTATWSITGVQLEAGTQATPFEYRQYGTELALCQRYYQTSGGALLNYPAFHYGSSAYTSVVLPVTMRSTPSIAYAGIGSTYYEQSTTYSFTVASFAANSPQSLTFQINVSGGTSGYSGTFYPIYQATAEL